MIWGALVFANLCVYIYKHWHIHIYIYTYIYTYMYTYIYIYISYIHYTIYIYMNISHIYILYKKSRNSMNDTRRCLNVMSFRHFSGICWKNGDAVFFDINSRGMLIKLSPPVSSCHGWETPESSSDLFRISPCHGRFAMSGKHLKNCLFFSLHITSHWRKVHLWLTGKPLVRQSGMIRMAFLKNWYNKKPWEW